MAVPTVKVNSAVSAIGIAITTDETRTAAPTVALGLNRMIRNAASKMSPSPSGRSGMAPGLWAAPSIPGGGAHGGGAPAGAGPGAVPGAGPGAGGMPQPGGGAPAPGGGGCSGGR